MHALHEEVNKLLKAGFIYPVDTTEWVSPVVVTPKKDGRWRICVDFKPLNAATKKDPYPLPFIDQILDSVASFERYSVCDGFSRYFQLKIAVEDKKRHPLLPLGVVFVIRFCLLGSPMAQHIIKKGQIGSSCLSWGNLYEILLMTFVFTAQEVNIVRS